MSWIHFAYSITWASWPLSLKGPLIIFMKITSLSVITAESFHSISWAHACFKDDTFFWALVESSTEHPTEFFFPHREAGTWCTRSCFSVSRRLRCCGGSHEHQPPSCLSPQGPSAPGHDIHISAAAWGPHVHAQSHMHTRRNTLILYFSLAKKKKIIMRVDRRPTTH